MEMGQRPGPIKVNIGLQLKRRSFEIKEPDDNSTSMGDTHTEPPKDKNGILAKTTPQKKETKITPFFCFLGWC
jgi:hypothetical protein